MYQSWFLNNVTAKIELSFKQFFLSKTISKEVNIKTKSATIAFFFPFSSFLSPPSFYFPFPRSFIGGFSGSFCLRFWSFFPSKDCNFRSARFQKSSKIMLWPLRLPILQFSLTSRHPQIYISLF